MRMKQLNNRIHLMDLTNQEKMYIRKTCVNITRNGDNLILEDNIFNRVCLGIDLECFSDDSDHSEINPKARDYQVKDIEHTLRLKNCLNRNKPGYGKTFESIEHCRLKGFKRILVVCPKSVVYQWKDQFVQWWPEMSECVQVLGNGPSLSDSSKGVIYITNYEQLTPRNIGTRKHKVLAPTQPFMKCKGWVWDIIIVDESHRIKTAGAQITIALKDLPSRHRMCLTGTPILGHPDDLWSQLNFLDPKISGNSYWEFVNRFCEVEEDHFGRKPVGLTPSENARNLLAKVLSIISVGGDNQNVTEGKNIIPIKLPMDVSQRNLYKDVVNLALDRLAEDGITVKNAMDQIIKQQQITTNCCKFPSCKHNPKFEWIRDWLEDNEGEKVVIFSKFAESAKALHEYLTKAKIKCELYYGEMSSKERQRVKDSFDSYRVLIGTIGALGTSVDGLQHHCRNVIFLDRDWTPGINEQAEDRVNRSGQVGMTNIWILNMEHSIDQHVEGITTKKAEDIEEVFKRVAEMLSA